MWHWNHWFIINVTLKIFFSLSIILLNPVCSLSLPLYLFMTCVCAASLFISPFPSFHHTDHPFMPSPTMHCCFLSSSTHFILSLSAVAAGKGTCKCYTLSKSAKSNSYFFSSSTGIHLVKVSKTKPLHAKHFIKEIQGETVSSSHLVSVPSSLS